MLCLFSNFHVHFDGFQFLRVKIDRIAGVHSTSDNVRDEKKKQNKMKIDSKKVEKNRD
jgi:hypothetical protein